MGSTKADIVSTEEFNSCNAWGFGGSTGTWTSYSNGYYRRKGQAHFRHRPSQSFDKFYAPQTDRTRHGALISKEEFFKECKA